MSDILKTETVPSLVNLDPKARAALSSSSNPGALATLDRRMEMVRARYELSTPPNRILWYFYGLWNIVRSFLENFDPAGHARVIAFTSDGALLRTFTSYSSGTEKQATYHQYLNTTSFITSQLRGFQERSKTAEESARLCQRNLRNLMCEPNDKYTATEQHIKKRYDDNGRDSGGSVRFLIAQDMRAATADSRVRAGRGCSEQRMEANT
jgi:hypothetical protein